MLRWGLQSHGFLGNILFVSSGIRHTYADVIALPGDCHRGAVILEGHFAERPVRLISAHLSLFQPLRIIQMQIIGQNLHRRPTMQTIFLGDLNEWRPWGGLMFHQRVVGTPLRGPVRAAFPSRRPFLPLDRILSDVPGAVQKTKTIRAPEAARASDHLPLETVVTVP